MRLKAGWRFVRGAPLTYLWLAVLLVTTVVQYQLSRHELHAVLVHRSTNIHHLGTDPLYVLFVSLFWVDGTDWLMCLLLFTLFLAPAEQWLRQIRWLAVGLTAHTVATYISEGLLYLAIQQHMEPERMVHVRDVGVSYFMVGVMAVLTYHIASPWRWGYLAALVIYYGAGLSADLNFTAIGHFSAIFIGLCFYPMARRRDGPPLNPARAFRRLTAKSGSR
ncbi:rhomboid-like protein [Mycobacterium sp.]|uniref:rhomboid-like protein n=1 Tax=Mycobacterium sp. TaxID=1785 RepID=UPI003D6C6AE7